MEPSRKLSARTEAETDPHATQAVAPPAVSMSAHLRFVPGFLGDRLFRFTTGFLAFLVLACWSVLPWCWRCNRTCRWPSSDLVSSPATNWDPVNEEFGALPFVYGTVVTSAIALLIAVPLSLGVALCMVEMLPQWLATRIGFLVELLAAIPSVVYGLWGIFVLGPWLRDRVDPLLARYLGFLPLFQGPHISVSLLTAGVLLSVMIIPT